MARVVKEFDERRRELLEKAGELFMAVGYEKMSVNMLCEAVGVAKGTFYHYFKTKEDLLSQWVIYRTEQALPAYETIAQDPDLDAVTKFNRIFQMGRDWKMQNIEMMIALMNAMYRDDNVKLRVALIQQSVPLMKRIMADVISQGQREGVFTTAYSEEMPSLILRIGAVFAEDMSHIILSHHENQDVSVEKAMRVGGMWEDTLARIVGAPTGSFSFVSKEFIQSFFGSARQTR